MRHSIPRSVPLALALALGLAACGGSGSSSSAKRADVETTTTVRAKPLDRSPFCVTIRALESLGTDTASTPSTPEAVLAENTKLSGLITTAAAAVPADAPADVAVLFDDYRLLSEAIVTANGDTAAAFASLATAHPELAARLGKADSHREAFVFFADRCGTAPPT